MFLLQILDRSEEIEEECVEVGRKRNWSWYSSDSPQQNFDVASLKKLRFVLTDSKKEKENSF
jgi:hypothetical protein